MKHLITISLMSSCIVFQLFGNHLGTTHIFPHLEACKNINMLEQVLMDWSVTDSKGVDIQRFSMHKDSGGPFYVMLSDTYDEIVYPTGQLRFMELDDFIGTNHISGNWGIDTNLQHSGGQALALTSKPGNDGLLTIPFTGTGIAIYGVRGRNCSQIRWSLDNDTKNGILELYHKDGSLYQDQLLNLTGLKQGEHTLTFSAVTEGYAMHNPWWKEFKTFLDYAIVENGGIISAELKRIHTYPIECLDGTVIFGDSKIRTYQHVKEAFIELTLEETDSDYQAEVLLVDGCTFENTGLFLEAFDVEGKKLTEGRDWFLNLGAFGKAAKLRITFESASFNRAPYINCLYVLKAPKKQESPSGPFVGFNPGTIKEATQTIQNVVGNFAWFPKPGMFPIDSWNRINKIDVFINAALMRDAGMAFMLSIRRGLGDFIRPASFLSEGWSQDTTPDIYTQEELEALRLLGGGYFLGVLMEEMDTSMVQGGLRNETRSEIPYLYDFITRAGGRAAFESEIKKYIDRYRYWGTSSFVNAGTTYQHAAYRVGADMVFGELGAEHVAYGMQLAMLRGASRQFDKDFGIWISLWADVKLPVPNYSPAVGRYKNWNEKDGHSAERLRQSMMLSYLSGAQIVTPQDVVPMFTGGNTGDWKLSDWGNVVKEVNGISKTLDKYTPDIRTAVLLDKDAGWTPGTLWNGFTSWTNAPYDNGSQYGHIWGKLKAETPELMEMAVFNTLYPGASDSGNSQYPGLYTDTPFGPVDVVQSDISLKALSAYDHVIVCGYFKPTQAEYTVLKQYVEQGGQLLLNVMQIEDYWNDADFLGGTISPVKKLAEQATMLEKHYKVSSEIFSYSGSAATLIGTNSGTLAINNAVGKGNIFLSLSPQYDLIDSLRPELQPYYTDLLQYVLGQGNTKDELLVTVTPGLEYLPVMNGNKSSLFLTNNSKSSITLMISAPKERKTAVDILTGKTFKGTKHNGKNTFAMKLEPYQFILFE